MAVSSVATSRLRRVLPFRTVVSTSTGLAYAAISLVSCVQIAAFMAGDSAWIALFIAGLLALLAALCFSELNALYPTAAAVRQYIKSSLNEGSSLTIAFGYVVTVVAVIAADSYIVGSAISYFFGQSFWQGSFLHQIPVMAWIFAILALATVSNLLGIKIAGTLQDITTYALLISLAAISLIALAHGGYHFNQPFNAFHSPGNLVNAVAVGVFTFSAFEWVTPLSEELNDTTSIPRGMFVSLGLLFISYSLFTVACTNLVHIGRLCQHIGAANQVCSPVPQMLLGQAALGEVGIVWMLIATIFTGVMTFNGGFAVASRFLYAAARDATLPPAFAKISTRLVPWVSILALAISSSVIAVLVTITGATSMLILVGAVLEAMIYAVAGLCVIQLRRRQREAARSFRIPLGWTIPVLSILIFTVLGLAAGLTPTPLPLLLTLLIFGVTFIYVWLYVPRLKAQAQVKRPVTRRRRVSSAAITDDQSGA
ncbi:MAG: APC family permease [Ktedonobacterales bacterium]